MNNKPILIREVSLLNAFFPLYASIAVMLFISVFGNVVFFIYLFCLIFSLILIYLSRYDNVKIALYENLIFINFYLLRKSIEVDYKDVVEISSYSSVYGGIFLKIVVNHQNKKYSIRSKFYDREFVSLLESKTGLKINSK